jgi:hypothetical protein
LISPENILTFDQTDQGILFSIQRSICNILCNFITRSLSRKIWLIRVTVLSLGTFTLVDSAGDVTESGELGLLLYNGGTICGKAIGNNVVNAANAVCHSMG